MSPQEKAAALIAARSLPALVTDWEVLDEKPFFTATSQEQSQIITVRGWYIDELERRNPDAFWAWIDSDEPSPRAFFLP